jgi:hypothetical protein
VVATLSTGRPRRSRPEASSKLSTSKAQRLATPLKCGKAPRLRCNAARLSLNRYISFAAGIKARREEREAWRRACDRQQRLEALAEARQTRETRRRAFAQELATTARDASELRSVLLRLQQQATAGASGDLQRLLEWLEQRVNLLEGKLTPERIAHAPRQTKLFSTRDALAEDVDDEDDTP